MAEPQSAPPANLSLENIEKLIHEKSKLAWREGKEGLEIYVVYLFAEMEFTYKSDAWGFQERSMEVDRLEKAWRWEEEDMEELMANENILWNKLGVTPKLIDARDAQAFPFIHSDIVFICMSIPQWVGPAQRPKFLKKTGTILKQFRAHNPNANIIGICKHPTFSLKKDPLFVQWQDIAQETSGFGKKGVLLGMLSQQLTSPGVLAAYLAGEHTTHKLQRSFQERERTLYIQALRRIQTDFGLMVIVHPQLMDVYEKKLTRSLRPLRFKKLLILPQNVVSVDEAKECNFFILFHCGFPEVFRNIPEFPQMAKQTVRVDTSLPSSIVRPPKREGGIINDLELSLLKSLKNLETLGEHEYIKFLKFKYEDYWRLNQEHRTSNQKLTELNRKLGRWQEGYFSLVEALCLEATQQVHSVSRFGGIMKSVTHYLLIDDFDVTGIIGHLVSRKFARTHVHALNSVEMLRAFSAYKREHPKMSAGQAYQSFLKEDPMFERYEVVLINTWSLSKDGSLSIKVRLSPPPEGKRKRDLSKVTLKTRNINEFLDMELDSQLGVFVGDTSLKNKSQQEQDKIKDMEALLEGLVSSSDFKIIARVMGIKKAEIFKRAQLEEDLKKIHKDLKIQKSIQKYEEEQEEEEEEQKNTGLMGMKKKPPRLSEEEELFGPLVKYRVDVVQLLAMACAMRSFNLLQNTKTPNFLKLESERTGQSQENVLGRCRICAISNSPLPEDGVLSAFPQTDAQRIFYAKTLPKKAEFDESDFSFYIINMQNHNYRDVISCLKSRNASAMSHVPMLIIVPENKSFGANTSEEISLSRHVHLAYLSGAKITEGPGQGFPTPHRIKSLDNPEQVKCLIQGMLGYDDEFLANLPEDLPGPDAPPPSNMDSPGGADHSSADDLDFI